MTFNGHYSIYTSFYFSIIAINFFHLFILSICIFACPRIAALAYAKRFSEARSARQVKIRYSYI